MLLNSSVRVNVTLSEMQKRQEILGKYAKFIPANKDAILMADDFVFGDYAIRVINCPAVASFREEMTGLFKVTKKRPHIFNGEYHSITDVAASLGSLPSALLFVAIARSCNLMEVLTPSKMFPMESVSLSEKDFRGVISRMEKLGLLYVRYILK